MVLSRSVISVGSSAVVPNRRCAAVIALIATAVAVAMVLLALVVADVLVVLVAAALAGLVLRAGGVPVAAAATSARDDCAGAGGHQGQGEHCCKDA